MQRVDLHIIISREQEKKEVDRNSNTYPSFDHYMYYEHIIQLFSRYSQERFLFDFYIDRNNITN